MSQVIQLDKPVFEASHTFANGALERRVSLPGSNSRFSIRASCPENTNENGFHVTVEVKAEDTAIRYKVDVAIGCFAYGTDSDTLNQNKTKSKHLLPTDRWDQRFHVTLKLTFAMERPLPSVVKQLFQCPLSGDVKSYIENGPTVTLVGSDASTKVSKRLLKIRSIALHNMLTHDTKEKRTMTIELKDFDCKTLDAFSHFLMTGEIKNGEETALGLVILGDKYDIQAMKEAGEKFVLNNLSSFDKEDVLDIFYRVSREILMGSLTKTCSK